MAVVVYDHDLFVPDFSLADIAIDEVAMNEELPQTSGMDKHPDTRDAEVGITSSESQNQPHDSGLLSNS